MSTTAQQVVSSSPIPMPPPPPNDDVPDKKAYINSALTADQISDLESSAEQFADILEWGAWRSNYSEAAKNVKHYRYGGGRDRRISAADIADIEGQFPKFSSSKNANLNSFLKDVAAQMRRDKLAAGQFISIGPSGRNWMGAYADKGKWFYAMGGFLYSFGAKATLISKGILEIRYKVYIYDRYNWDLGDIPLPKNSVDAADIATPGSIEPAKKIPMTDGRTYVEESGDKYIIHDEIMGVLAAKGKANFYDIRGETAEQVIYINDK